MPVTDTADLERHLRDRDAELALVQALAHIGSWSWDPVRRELRWSEELLRIHGVDATPESLEDCLTLVHDADRPMVAEALARAGRTGEPFEFEHRAVRSDGIVRWLHCRGQGTCDDAGTVTHVHGTVQDVTARRTSQHAHERSERRFRALLHSAPDAVVVIDRAGTIVLANEQTDRLFGYEPGALLGSPVETLLPQRARAPHLGHRAEYAADPRTRPMGAGLELAGLRRDGTEFPVDISLSAIETDDGSLVMAFVRDVTDRKRAEDDARALRAAEERRRQALEINDGIVQGLTTGWLALETGRIDDARAAVRATLESARTMMGKLLTEATGGRPIVAGDLVRDLPAAVVGLGGPLRAPGGGGVRVLIADDTEDVRFMLRTMLAVAGGFVVVAEAGDGLEAVRLAQRHQPDAILLDLAMPRMDGLQAIPELKREVPSAKIVVLSGYGRGEAAAQAIGLGADEYLEKGAAARLIVDVLQRLCRAG